MKIINFSKEPDIDAIVDTLHEGAVIVHLGSVYGVVALPNRRGVFYLNLVKKRKSGKCYGSLVSDSRQFVRDSILDAETKLKLIECMDKGLLDNSFIRIPWEDNGNKELILNGTHQGLKTIEPIRTFCRVIEDKLIKREESLMIRGLICSSANISGDPRGSITDRKEAIQFGLDRGIKLFVEFDFQKENTELGSFPIFSFNNMTFTSERKGPGSDNIQKLLLENGFLERN